MGDAPTGDPKAARENLAGEFSRRRFVRSAGVATVLAATVGAATAGDHPGGLVPFRPTAAASASGPSGALTARERAMILRVAKVGAVYPITFPNFGESGPAVQRATIERLMTPTAALSAGRLELARDGARDLLGAGLLGSSRAGLVHTIGRKVRDAGTSRPPEPLTAVVALAVATVSRHFNPADDSAAELWLEFAKNLVIIEDRNIEGH